MADRDQEVQQVLDSIDALGTAETPAARAKRLTQLLDAMPEKQAKVREMRQQAVTEMRDEGMSLRAIAAELGISFGRVRDIIDGVTKRPPKKPAANA
ncbi:sigma-70 family RNA polymerase sigma factor [Streptomyces sp. JV180]|uniref:sigma-70 family RNA polymerase sigma factor n=1 Tax=Streptomyces sp. JV180 TaxID=858634 RepID=UPI00168B6159|nr:sigma-70 family RNA polymerase sigma factor [Streptomyces sp. JV180]MBD3546813.1 sigma-70 family RNA polymerase sigma factor [Streptomyces sp. JV180]